jgi:hypothetical protein
MQRVINFSGGKTSGFMTISEYQEGDIVLFCDTGREHPKTYKFLNDFEAHEGIPVVRITTEGGFEGILKRRGFKTLPNRMRRFCTEDLKIIAAKRYLKSIGIIRYENLIGFRSDEPQRVKGFKEKFKKVQTKFPLYDKGITKEFINDFWSNKPYTLEIPSILGNCTLCFMKGKNAITAILREYPELAEPWIADEERNNKKGHTYLPNITIRQLRDHAQNNLFKDYDLQEIKPAFDCACTV